MLSNMNDIEIILIYAGCLCLFELVISYGVWMMWIYNKGLIKLFPNWEGTKKPQKCYLIWFLSMLLDEPIYIGIASAVPNENYNYLWIMIVVGWVWFFIVALTFRIIQIINKKHIDKENKNDSK